MDLDNKVPDDVVANIILVFLLGVKTELVDSGGIRVCDLIRGLHSPIYTTWKDVLSLRKTIAHNMSRSDKKKLHKLAKALKKVWKL